MKPDSVPFMKYIKVIKNGHVTWRKESCMPLSEEQYLEIISLPSEKAKFLPTEEKRIWFYQKIQHIKEEAMGIRSTIYVRRENLLQDSFNQFREKEIDLRGELKVNFLGEEAQDVGGLIREWYSIIIEQLFSTDLKLFKKANIKELSYIINKDESSTKMEWYKFAGNLIAKAIFERIPIKAYLNKTILQQILGDPLKTSDLESYDEELWNSVVFLKDNQICDDTELGITFTVEEEKTELKENGRMIKVNDKNKQEFCKLFANHVMYKSTEELIQALLEGFHSLIPKSLISILDTDELELFLCGHSDIDVNDWKENTIYKGVYNEDHMVIKWFWETIENLSENEKKRFLQFCTGSSRVPAEGFKGLLADNGKICSFCIDPKKYTGPNTSFIIAHTCFNRIELPEYPNKKILETNLKGVLNSIRCIDFAFD